MDWTQIEFVLDMEEEGGRTRPFLDGWETIRFVMADEERDMLEKPGAGTQEREDMALDPERVDL